MAPNIFEETEAYRASIDPTAIFSSEARLYRDVLHAEVRETAPFTNCLQFRVLIFLQVLGMIPTAPPRCRHCNKEYCNDLYEKKRTRKQDETILYYHRGPRPKKARADKSLRCSCFDEVRTVTKGTFFESLSGYFWAPFLHCVVLMIQNVTAKDILKKLQEEHTNVNLIATIVEQWRIWILELSDNWLQRTFPASLGGPDVPQLSIDETSWRRKVSKDMAPNPDNEEKDGSWIWACLECVRCDGDKRQQGRQAWRKGTMKLGRVIFEICPSKSDAAEGKPRGTVELERFASKWIAPGSLVVSDGWSATKAINWGSLGCRYEFCTHSKKQRRRVNLSKPVNKFDKKASQQVRETQKTKLWVNERGFHTNHVESLFSKLKRWARKKNGGALPSRGKHFYLYLSDFTLRRTCSLKGESEYVEQIARALAQGLLPTSRD